MGGALRGLNITLRGLGVSDQECCDKAVDSNGMPCSTGRAGCIACCNGVAIPCAYHYSEKDPETLALKRRATLIHEGVHARDQRTHSGAPCNPNKAIDGCATVSNLEESECNAYATEMPWLEKAYDECTTDYCRREFDRQIRWTCAAQNGTEHGSDSWNSANSKQGDWMGRYCRQAGLQVPSEAQRVCKRFTSMVKPTPLPPRDIIQKGAPILEMPEISDKPRALSFKAPTIEFPLNDEYIPPKFPPMTPVKGGRPDSMGKCPDGWSYIMLDGKARCRNNASGEFRELNGNLVEGLSGLGFFAGLGASKKKKKTPKPKPVKPGQFAPQARASAGFNTATLAKIVAPVAVSGATYAATKSPLISLAVGVGAYFATSYLLGRDRQGRPAEAGRAGTNQLIPNY